eukprot:Opistho-2@12359
MNVGKCRNCQKTVYQLEAVTVGPPKKVEVFHKSCFKCDQPGCSWPINVSNYKYMNDKVWCQAHCPMSGASYGGHTGNSQDIHSQTIQAAVNSPKQSLVNKEVRQPPK